MLSAPPPQDAALHKFSGGWDGVGGARGPAAIWLKKPQLNNNNNKFFQKRGAWVVG